MSATGTVPRKALKQVEVGINVDKSTNTITVKPDPCSLNSDAQEEVMWVCKQDHDHNHKTNTCFMVHFIGTSPFAKAAFTGPEAHSGCAVISPNKQSLYVYTVWVPGFEPRQGGVKP
jgi:hypothetical protein